LANEVITVSRNLDGFSLVNQEWFAKFTKLSSHQTFPLYGTSLLKKDLECANNKARNILLSNVHDCMSKMSSQKRGKYYSYTPKEQAKIGEYAAV